MNQISSKAILVVSFGTSYKEARIASIEQIEKDISEAFPDFRIYHAWTSKMILSVLRKRDSLVIPTVKEAMEQMIQDGITELIVQPTHILDGIENNIMKEDVLSYKEEFQSIVFGPLFFPAKRTARLSSTPSLRNSRILLPKMPLYSWDMELPIM